MLTAVILAAALVLCLLWLFASGPKCPHCALLEKLNATEQSQSKKSAYPN
jgi:hypothetical protein